MNIDNRKHTRFSVQDDTFAALEFRIVGKVKDLSMEGLAFEYINISENPGQEYSDKKPFKPSQLSIFLSNNKFHLSDVPCKIAYDIDAPVSDTQKKFITSLRQRLCGVKFGMLPEDIIAKLDFFINNHTKELT